MTPKKKMPREKISPKVETPFEVRVEKAANLQFVANQTRGSQYDDILAKVGKLKDGEWLVIAVPKNTEPRTMYNRLSSAMVRVGLTAPKGYRYTRRCTTNGEIAIGCIPAKTKK